MRGYKSERDKFEKKAYYAECQAKAKWAQGYEATDEKTKYKCFAEGRKKYNQAKEYRELAATASDEPYKKKA
ncbi:MAG: hypothetical protein IJ274_03625 [Lachnospiraceae bacterium]|nr:hypothetical protein [Lachnospiraceae bacterium]